MHLKSLGGFEALKQGKKCWKIDQNIEFMLYFKAEKERMTLCILTLRMKEITATKSPN